MCVCAWGVVCVTAKLDRPEPRKKMRWLAGRENLRGRGGWRRQVLSDGDQGDLGMK